MIAHAIQRRGYSVQRSTVFIIIVIIVISRSASTPK